MQEQERGSSASPAVGRALDILGHLATRPGPVRAATLARELGIPSSSAYHILAILIDRGFVVHLPEERAYGLGAAALELGAAHRRHEPLERLARPVAGALARRLGHPVHLGVLHGAETVYLLKEQPPARRHDTGRALVTGVGVRLPAHLTATGRALLAHCAEAQLRAAFPRPGALVTRTGKGPRSLTELRAELDRERTRGWSEETELVAPDLRSIGVAAFDHLGHPVAALSATWCRHHQPHDAERIRDALLSGAARLTAAVSGRAPHPRAS
ncbi:IclR family transcriptional regulator [Streptomyces benahoarensis]|uniref:IclR family transcriptional regulator n=1 Tax=Streptomyces benahoarensis TaxID=2595054 RepID=A0A553ZPF7_9ACTN|nr:IclR family transcriptional regulator [Streptomyces benahoarensis]TSB22703.1 IclR family transcriptional regulator [Streptomyces benahoarensis]TSB43348.1 IclR family transcriptional regulator [Streptomyces benahoarensis]